MTVETPVSSLNVVRHNDDYDPEKRREYYLRTRELKGRDPAQQNPENRSKSSGSSTPPPAPKQTPKAIPLPTQKRVDNLKGSLAVLKEKLQSLLDKAKKDQEKKKEKSEGTSEKSEGSSKKSNSSEGSKRELSEDQKVKARKRSKDWYEENKELVGDTDVTEKSDIDDQVAVIRKRITETKNELQSIIDNARSKLNG